MSGWIKCSDRQPSGDAKYVLAHGTSTATPEPSVMIGWYCYGSWLEANNGDYIDGGYGNDYPAVVTHWQPLPSPPTE
ncbi:DUF551 domain-containing protein [Pseudomonas putida]|uniref:DUF551 domain-containing protein n=1 Tax=Pseudomonas putida TaxID=303 RepID=UPI0009C113AA